MYLDTVTKICNRIFLDINDQSKSKRFHFNLIFMQLPFKIFVYEGFNSAQSCGNIIKADCIHPLVVPRNRIVSMVLGVAHGTTVSVVYQKLVEMHAGVSEAIQVELSIPCHIFGEVRSVQLEANGLQVDAQASPFRLKLHTHSVTRCFFSSDLDFSC